MKRSNYSGSKNKTKKAFTWFGIIALVITVSVLVTSWIGSLSKGFENMDPKDWEFVELNENNLIDADALIEEFNDGSGYSLVKNDNGTITVKGSNEDEAEATVELGKITLKPGEYTFTTGKNGKYGNATKLFYNLSLVNGDTTHYADFGGTLTVEAETEYTIVLTLGAEKSFNGITLYPVIVEGDEAEGYFN